MGTHPPSNIHGAGYTMGHGRQAGSTHPTGMLSSFIMLWTENYWEGSVLNSGDWRRVL